MSMSGHFRVIVALAAVFVGAGSALAQIDSELSAYVASRRKAMDDSSKPIAERVGIALEIEATLDRAAWASDSPAVRRGAWSTARSVLDGFSSRNPKHQKEPFFRFQAAVYLWAEGQSWARAGESGDRDAQAAAASAFDEVIARLRKVLEPLAKSDEPLAQNTRYRLAKSLFDRANLDPDRPATPALREEALRTLEARPLKEKNLVGFAQLLHADLLASAGRYKEAREALDQSAKADSRPPISERLASLVPIAAGLKDYSGAKAEIEKAEIPRAEKHRLKLRLTIAERAALSPGDERSKIEADCFRIATELRTSDPAEFAGALRELAQAIDEPSSQSTPEAWAMLAEGAAAMKQLDRAARLDVIASAKAEGRGDLESARRWRYRAAANSFSAGRFARADSLFSRVLEDKEAGSLRPKAGMMRAICRGKGLAAGEVGITREGYVSALVDQVRDFPTDPATGEAIWLLGQARLEDGDRAQTEKLWASVPRAHARWIDSRLGLIRLLRRDLDERRLVDEPATLHTFCESARSAIASARREARDESERTDFDLEDIGLDLAPIVAEAKRGLQAAEHLRALPLNAEQRSRTDALRILALAESERFLDAERASAEYAGQLGHRLILAYELDRWASSLQNDRLARRVGGIERIVADRIAAMPNLAPATVSEVRLWRARGRIIAGDFEGAKAIVKDWANPVAELSTNLDCLGELLVQTGEHEKAAVAFRTLARKTPSGSPRWLAARLGHAKALVEAGQITPAKQILEGTTLLHPDLGGPTMRQEFSKLKAKVDRR